jgi:hypothetical protein
MNSSSGEKPDGPDWLTIFRSMTALLTIIGRPFAGRKARPYRVPRP